MEIINARAIAPQNRMCDSCGRMLDAPDASIKYWAFSIGSNLRFKKPKIDVKFWKSKFKNYNPNKRFDICMECLLVAIGGDFKYIE